MTDLVPFKTFRVLDKERSETEKQRGTRAYKRQDFDAAVSHYEEALNLNPQGGNSIMRSPG